MKKYIIGSLVLALVLGIIFGISLDINFSSFYFSFNWYYLLFIISFLISSIILMFVGINLPFIYLYFDTFIFGILMTILFKSYGLTSFLFAGMYLIICKLPLYFSLILISFYIFKLIKHFYKYLLKKERSYNFKIYFKKVVVMLFLITIYFLVYSLSFFLINKMTNFLLFDTIMA